jgi:hypothetical protein
MSSKISQAFNRILQLSAFSVTWERPGNPVISHTIKVSHANFDRNREGPEELTMAGKEFVVSRTEIEGLDIFPMKKGDRLVDESPGGYGINMVFEIVIMKGLTGEIVGYRVRTN